MAQSSRDVTEGQMTSMLCAMVDGVTLEREVRVQLATIDLDEEKAACKNNYALYSESVTGNNLQPLEETIPV